MSIKQERERYTRDLLLRVAEDKTATCEDRLWAVVYLHDNMPDCPIPKTSVLNPGFQARADLHSAWFDDVYFALERRLATVVLEIELDNTVRNEDRIFAAKEMLDWANDALGGDS